MPYALLMPRLFFFAIYFILIIFADTTLCCNTDQRSPMVTPLMLMLREMLIDGDAATPLLYFAPPIFYRCLRFHYIVYVLFRALILRAMSRAAYLAAYAGCAAAVLVLRVYRYARYHLISPPPCRRFTLLLEIWSQHNDAA